MATMQDAVRRLSIEATTRGVKEAEAAVRGLAGAHDGLTVSTQGTEKATVSVERALAGIQRRYDAAYRSQKELERVERELSRAQSQGLITLQRRQELLGLAAERHGLATAAINREITATERLAAAQTVQAAAASRAMAVTAANQNSRAGGSFAATNIAYQAQDIAVTAQMGMSPAMIALQQGSQLGMALQSSLGQAGAAGAVRTLGAAFLGLLSPINLVAIAGTGLLAWGLQYAFSTKDGVDKADEALKKHEDALRAVATRWGEIVPELQRYADQTAKARDLEDLRKTTQEQTNRLLAEAREQMAGVSEEIFRLNTALLQSSDGAEAIASLENAFGNLQTKLADGTARAGDLKAVQDALATSFTSTGIPAVGQLAELVGRLAGRFAEAADQAANLNRNASGAALELMAAPGQRGVIIGGSGERERNEYLDRQRLAMRDMQLRFGIDQMAIGARSPAALAEVARRRAELQTVSGENDDTRRLRIELAGRQALIQAEYQLTEAQRDRARSLASTVDAQRFELDLVGKTAGEIAGLRLEYQMTAQLREEAAKRGVAVDQAEIELIKLKAAELKKVVEAKASQTLMDDLAFERAQLGRSSADQRIASRLLGAGLPVDLNSPEARAMRENMQFASIQGDVSSFLNDFRQALVSNGGNLGEALSLSVQNAAMRAFDRTMEDLISTISNMIAEAASGRGGLGGGSGGVIGSLVGSLFAGPALSPSASAAIASGGGGLYSRGGVSTRPSVISEHGQPEAAVPLPDGRRIPVDLTMPEMRGQERAAPAGPLVSVQVINNASNTRAREERSAGPDGREMRRIIIEEVKGEMASGGFDGVMTGRYGASPQRVAR